MTVNFKSSANGTAGALQINGNDVISFSTEGVVSPTLVGNISLSGNTTLSKVVNVRELATVSATAANGTINYDVNTQSVLYYTTNAAANWTTNFRGNSSVSMDTLLSNGQSITLSFLVTNGTTAYFANNTQVDSANVTPKWQGGTAPTGGNANSVDSYTYTIIKTGTATFTVLASQSRFA